MEEDIKILEEFTESSCCLASQEEIIEHVKNLIKGYRELGEDIHKEYTLGYSQGVYDCSEGWKETIQEKIEEIIKSNPAQDEEWDGTDYKVTSEENFAIEMLEDLLEE